MVLQAISGPLVEVSRRTNEMPGVPEAGLRQHWAIYRAIRENNPEKAQRAMRAHLAAAERNAHNLRTSDAAISSLPVTTQSPSAKREDSA
jgi:DNA-binding FadR family transcriptional regulator